MNSLAQVISFMRAQGCADVFLKDLAENDNPKNQVYFGPDFKVLNAFPNLDIQAAKTGTKETPIFKSDLCFSWINEEGNKFRAPHAKLIFYPQYPEVRFSGFLLGCKGAPSQLMNQRLKDRKLFIGVSPTGESYGYLVGPDHPIALEVDGNSGLKQIGVFRSLRSLLYDVDSKDVLLAKLMQISEKGWIESKRLNKDGKLLPCLAPNCGGYTLEAELGIIPNGIAEPDYLGWEVKQHKVSNFEKLDAGAITLMTPEPTDGMYCREGVIPFVMKYGYPDKCGRPDRMNFGGVHRAGQRHALTGLSLELLGFDPVKKKITKSDGGIALVSIDGEIAAFWDFAGLMKHWNKKHAQAVYVPSLVKKDPVLEYEYGPVVRLGEGTNFLKLLEAFTNSTVYYDPGIKVENMSSSPKTKRRSQFRIKSGHLDSLYSTFSKVSLF
jgi:hypothetical protein